MKTITSHDGKSITTADKRDIRTLQGAAAIVRHVARTRSDDTRAATENELADHLDGLAKEFLTDEG